MGIYLNTLAHSPSSAATITGYLSDGLDINYIQ
jgi:hypothetical protein